MYKYNIVCEIAERFKSKCKSFSKSQDGKVLVQNFAYLTLLQVAGYVFPLLTLPYLARVVGAEGFGKIAFASAIIIWIQTIADWGFNFTATRDVAKNRENKVLVSVIFSNVFWARCVLMVFSFLLLLLMIFFIPEFKKNSAVIMVSFLMIPGHIMFPDWFFQALERMKYITVLNLLAKLVFTLAVFLFIKEKDDYILQPLFISLGFMVSGIIAMYCILVRWQVKLYKPTLPAIICTIKGSSNVFINNLMPNLYSTFSTILLGFFAGPVSNGIYDAGKKFIAIFHSMISIISRTFFPYLVRKDGKHVFFARLTISVSLLGSIMLLIFAPLLIRLFFTEEFIDAIIVLRITSIALVFITLDSVYGTNYLIIHHCDRLLRNITAVVSCVGFVSAFPLIYYFDYIGAAFTFLFSNMLIGVGVTYYAIKIRKIKRK
ncbi:oligosaccharide flippase family protein [Butyricimonas paravirosa]|uniref:oligosaccharide flippase family protein n=1 Tax=Butyricimonas paravirosa TaxID=1472417 RepID=UPI0022DF53CD|nr:oligosaccharide flippase family protein [Butyricimonas paravirosa]